MTPKRARGFRAISALTTALAVAFLVAAATGTSARADDSPFVRDAVFEGPSDLVWRLLTTEQGVESWLTPHAQIDLRVGGLVKTNHDPNGSIGDGSTLVNRVLSLTPGRAISVRVDQAPTGYPMANMVEGTWYEVTVHPVAARRSRVRCVGHGLPSGYMAMMVKPMFDRMADMVYDHLRTAVDREARRLPPPKPAKTDAKVATKSSSSKKTPPAPGKAPSKRSQ